MAKEKQEIESEIINETDTTTELTVENQGKELIAQTNFSSSNLIKEFEREQLKKQLPEICFFRGSLHRSQTYKKTSFRILFFEIFCTAPANLYNEKTSSNGTCGGFDKI